MAAALPAVSASTVIELREELIRFVTVESSKRDRLAARDDRGAGILLRKLKLEDGQSKSGFTAVLSLAISQQHYIAHSAILNSTSKVYSTLTLPHHNPYRSHKPSFLTSLRYLIKPCELAQLELQAERAYEKARLARENQTLKAVLRRTEPPGEIIGTTPVIRRVLCLIDKVAPTDSSVLIQGESGTGKELVARALHRGSPRADKPMVVINCAALQESLLENELFGHEKGAFTSAVTAKQGLFELADGGTLFIDEIGEMAPPLQAKLLRALEDRRIRRVGSTREIRTDVRFLAATNKDLAQEVAASRFRDDLYYRLNVITIATPPLRERIEDIPLLVRHFLTLDPCGPRHIEPEALELLVHHRWPGNVRELANVIERAKILAEGPSIAVGDLPDELRRPPLSELPCPAAPPASSSGMSLGALERQHILQAMEAAGGNKVRAARALGISRRRLYRLLEKQGLDGPATA